MLHNNVHRQHIYKTVPVFHRTLRLYIETLLPMGRCSLIYEHLHVQKNTPNLLTWWNFLELTHWGRVTHICVIKLNIIGSDNGLSPGRRQAIIGTNAGILLIRPLGTNFNDILIEIHRKFKKMHLKMSSAKWRPCCLDLNVLNGGIQIMLLNFEIIFNTSHTKCLV